VLRSGPSRVIPINTTYNVYCHIQSITLGKAGSVSYSYDVGCPISVTDVDDPPPITMG
jgi:hypothetical protein